MRIIASEFVSLDAVMEDPGGAEEYEHGGWSFGYFGPEIDQIKKDELFEADALLLGRITYQGFAAAWAVAHGAVVADLAHDGVEEDHRIDSVERPGLPVLDLAQHGVGDPADQIRGHVHLVDLAQVRLDVPHGHASGLGG